MAAIRAAAPADVPGVLELWAAARSPAATAVDSDEALATLTAHDPGALLVAEADGELAGAIVVGWDGWRGAIYRLAVRPSARRRGIGTALVREAEASLLRKGCRRLGLVTGVEEEAAIAFWTALGYEADRELLRLSRNL